MLSNVSNFKWDWLISRIGWSPDHGPMGGSDLSPNMTTQKSIIPTWWRLILFVDTHVQVFRKQTFPFEPTTLLGEN